MSISSQPTPEIRARITTPQDAELLVTNALDSLDELEPIIDNETRQLRAGLLREALLLAEAKAEAGKRYIGLIQTLKDNAIAIGRFRPPALALLKRRHQIFSENLALNAAVLTTARTVSESIIRELSAEISGSANPQGYGARGNAMSAYNSNHKPMAISKNL